MGSEGESALYEPSSFLHPGETVLEYLEFNSWSQRELARRTGLTPKTISEICSGKAAISTTTALAFEKVFRRPAHFWLALQRRFDEAEARAVAAPREAKWSAWVKQFPVAEMKSYGWLEPSRKQASVEGLLEFFGVNSPDAWETVWKAAKVSYRQTRKFPINVAAISAWVRATELYAADIQTADYSAERLRTILGELRHETRYAAERCVPAVQELCASAGVAVVWVPELKRTGISGCARWLSDRKALIALTLRYKADDQIWFTFFHEVAHILLHRRQHAFVLDNAAVDLADNVIDPQMRADEEEANRFAADTLIPPAQLADFIARTKVYTNEAIIAFAEEVDVGPGIVVGRLHREGILAFHQGQTLKRTFELGFKEADM